MEDLYTQTKSVVKSFLDPFKQELTPDTLLVVGCSTSEVMGGSIGKNSNQEAGAEIAKAVLEVVNEYSITLAAQCCEHLNRALVVEKTTAQAHRLSVVAAVPMPKAGGSFGTAVHRSLKEPVLVEEVQADYGLDIGQTMIGMHLKRVAIPLRLSPNTIGSTTVQGAKTRPRLIGGERAMYAIPPNENV